MAEAAAVGSVPVISKPGRLLTVVLGVAITVLLLVAFLALFGDALFMRTTSPSNDTFGAPSLAHLFGTDNTGQDWLSLVVQGTRVTVVVGLGAALVSTIIGLLIGGLAGLVGGVVDGVLMRFSELVQVMPRLVLATLIIVLYGAGLLQIVAVIALLSWPQTARVVRADILRLRTATFVDALRCLGVGSLRLLVRELLPNVMGPVVALGTLEVAQAILLQSSLAFLGLGSGGSESWGSLLNTGQTYLQNAWWLSFFPGFMILLTVMSTAIVGDALYRRFDVKRER